MATARIELPEKLIPVFDGDADVRYAYGGRGSAKTRSFAKMIAVRGYMHGMAGTSGILLCARQFMNSLEDSSLEECKRAIEDEPWLAAYYEIGDRYIKSRDGRIAFVFAGLDRNIASIKSKGRLLVCWVDEAEPVTDEAWTTLIPTLREEGEDWNAELWVTWNPKRKTAPVEKRFRNNPDPRIKGAELNWRDNPKFPQKLERDRQRDLAERPEQYDHIWEGGYVTALEGAYYAAHLLKAKQEGRIGFFPADPMMTIRLVVDIGGTGAKADAFALWAMQFIGREIRVVNYYEAVGQPLDAHIAWCRTQGYTPDRAQFWLPHDGATQDKVYAVSYESTLKAAGYTVTVVPNQGRGAAMARVDKARVLFPQIRFNESTTEAGRLALGWYHEKRDLERGIGLGPEHDWSSHACLAAGSMVETVKGLVPIESMKRGMQVVTPSGPALVSWAGKVKETTELIRVTLGNGSSLTMTPEHKVFTTRGVVCADALGYNDEVIIDRSAECLRLDRANLMGYRAAFIEIFSASDTGSGRSEDSMSHSEAGGKACFTASHSAMGSQKLSQLMAIGRTSILRIGSCARAILAALKSLPGSFRSSMDCGSIATQTTATTAVGILEPSSCIDTFGRSTTDRSLMGSISTIETKTRQTTGSKTWSFFLPASMLDTILSTANGLEATRTARNSLESEKRLPNGIAAKLAGRGTGSTGSAVGKIAQCTEGVATAVAKSTKRLTQPDRSFAARVVSSERLTVEKQSVYDITVERDHCYVANGMLVSNSDAFGLGCVTWREPQEMKPIDYGKLPIV